MTTETKAGEWVLCRGQAIHVTEEEIQRSLKTNQRSNRRWPRSRRVIAKNIALGKRIGTYKDWPRNKDEEA